MSEKYSPYSFREPNLAPTSVKRQHYVPQRYLAQFTSNDRIDVYEPATGKGFVSVVGNVAVESYFYDLRYEQEKLSTEDWFLREVEGPFWPVLDRLCSDPDAVTHLNEAEETIIGRYVAAQRLRVPRRREYIERTRREFRAWAAELVSNKEKKAVAPDEIDQYVQDNGAIPWLRSQRAYQAGEAMSAELGEITGDARMLMAKPWRIGWTDGSLPLYTSDNPVSSHLPSVRPNNWDDFYDTEQYFPLGPRTLLHFGTVPRGGEIPYFGPRRRRDFTKWETSYARAVITFESTTQVFGTGGATMPRALARRNMSAFDHASLDFAVEFCGYDQSKVQPAPKEVIKLVDPRIPDFP